MTAASTVLFVVALCGLVVVSVALGALIVTLRSLRDTVDDLRRQTLPAIEELRATVSAANGELARVDSLLDSAEEVGARVEATSKLAWLVMRSPLVKLASASVAAERRTRRGAPVEVGSGSARVLGPAGARVPAADDTSVVSTRRSRRRAG